MNGICGPKCLGKVILINGVSSSGKTFTSNYIKKYGFNILNADEVSDQILINYLHKFDPYLISDVQNFLEYQDIRKIWFGYRINKDKYDYSQQKAIEKLECYANKLNKEENCLEDLFSNQNLYSRMFEEVKSCIFSGLNVAIDAVVTSSKELSLLSFMPVSHYKTVCTGGKN